MKYFLAVVDCRSFTEAAEECYISQSAISQQIDALEKELGVQLIIRQKRRFELTPEGEFLYEYCRKLVNDADNLKKRLTQFREMRSKLLKVGCQKNCGGEYLLVDVDMFKRALPDVNIDVINFERWQVRNLLKTGMADVVLCNQYVDLEDEEIVYITVKRKIIVFLPVNSPLKQNQRITKDALQGHTCILISSEESFEEEKFHYRSRFGIDNDFLRADNLGDAMMMLVSGKGYLLACENFFNNLWLGGLVECVPMYCNNKAVYDTLYAVWEKKSPNKYIQDFVNIWAKEK